ncbi:LLM class flavin-dependent oxidoreductase [Bradyrhizobium sp. LB13.1]
MEIGYFTMPSHPPECGLKEGNDWDLQVMRWLDELGYQEAWVGEHHTAPWEPNPTPDLLIAQALMQTKRLRIGPGGFLLPYHHPAELANRVAMLDHLSEGRAQFRGRGQRPAERLGDVQRRRHERAEPRHDPRGAGDHSEDVERSRALDLQG